MVSSKTFGRSIVSHASCHKILSFASNSRFVQIGIDFLVDLGIHKNDVSIRFSRNKVHPTLDFECLICIAKIILERYLHGRQYDLPCVHSGASGDT